MLERGSWGRAWRALMEAYQCPIGGHAPSRVTPAKGAEVGRGSRGSQRAIGSVWTVIERLCKGIKFIFRK